MFLKILQILQENTCVGVSTAGLQLYWKQAPTQLFSCEICEIFKNTYFVEHLRTAASDGSESDDSENDDESYDESIEAVVRRCSSK